MMSVWNMGPSGVDVASGRVMLPGMETAGMGSYGTRPVRLRLLVVGWDGITGVSAGGRVATGGST